MGCGRYTERDFKAYRAYIQAQQSGRNMITDWVGASKDAGLSLTVYTKVVRTKPFIEKAIIKKYGSLESYINGGNNKCKHHQRKNAKR